jgi:hypothetical protein
MSDADVRLQRAIANACLGAHAGESIARDLRSFLQGHGVDADDIEAVLASSAPARLAVYRSLVRNGLGSVVQRMLPRTRARMNACCAGRFDADLAAFAEEVGPRTHYLRDVPAELFAWAAPRWRADVAVPPYLVDLAAFELAAFAVAASASVRAPEAVAEVAIDRPLLFAESARILRFAWAVHELPASDDDATEPPRRDAHLLAYRDADHAVRWLELTPLAAAVIERLLAGEALGGAVQRACADHGAAPAAVLADVARLLADLGARGVVVGGAQSG